MASNTTRKKYKQRLRQSVKLLDTVGMYQVEMADVYREKVPDVAALLDNVIEIIAEARYLLDSLEKSL